MALYTKRIRPSFGCLSSSTVDETTYAVTIPLRSRPRPVSAMRLQAPSSVPFNAQVFEKYQLVIYSPGNNGVQGHLSAPLRVANVKMAPMLEHETDLTSDATVFIQALFLSSHHWCGGNHLHPGCYAVSIF